MSVAQRSSLIQRSIEQLEHVSAVLESEVRSIAGSNNASPVEQRISKEVLLTIRFLLPKLRTVRNFSTLTVPPDDAASPP